MNLIVAGFLELLAITKRNKRIIFFLLLFFLYFIISRDVHTDDRSVYRNTYTLIENISLNNPFELGFQFLMYISKKIGFSFNMFVCLFSMISFTIMAAALLRISNNPACVLGLYMLYPFLLDAEQLRSFFGTAIVLYGMSFILTKKHRGYLIFVISCLIATTIQNSCFIYLIYSLVILPEKVISKIIIFISILFIIGRKYIIYLTSFFTILNDDKIDKYFGNLSVMGDWYIYIAYYCVLIFFCMFLIKKYIKHKDVEEKEFLDTINKLNIISIGLLPLIYINGNFERVFRLILIVDYCTITNFIGSKIKKYNELYLLLFIYAFAGVRFLSYVFGAGWERLIVPFFLK